MKPGSESASGTKKQSVLMYPKEKKDAMARESYLLKREGFVKVQYELAEKIS